MCAMRAVPDHPKFAELKALLRLPKGVALGWLESIWHFTGRFTPHGNIGKYSDAAIESWVEWDGAPGALITALVQAGWLDRSADCRIIVHDWHIHADNATKLAVKRSKMPFCVAQCGDTVDAESIETAKTSTRRRLPEPEPVPEPEPGPEPSSIAFAIAESCQLSGWRNRQAIEGQVEVEAKKDGYDPNQTREAMIRAWEKYTAHADRIKWTVGAEKFFADGLWRDEKRWPWKDGQEPGANQSHRRYMVVDDDVERVEEYADHA